MSRQNLLSPLGERIEVRGNKNHSFLKFSRITSNTASVFFRTSSFQKRITLYSFDSSHLALPSSFSACPAWCPPSTSTINFLSTQTKSTINFPTGYCRLNLNFSSRRSRNLDHNLFSAFVEDFLNALAFSTNEVFMEAEHKNIKISQGNESIIYGKPNPINHCRYTVFKLLPVNLQS